MATKIIILAVGGIILLGSTFAFAQGPDQEQQILEPTVMEAIPAPTSVDDPRFDQVAAVLNHSATGRQLLQLKEAYMVSVQFEEGTGTRFLRRANLISLDSRHDPIKAALFFAHEMNHARTVHEGKVADPTTESRQAYINLKIQEEVEGMMASFQVKMELEKVGIHMANKPLPLEIQYRQAYQAAANQAQLADGSLSEKQLDTIGRDAGEQALFDAFASGEVKTSTNQEPYPDYFERRWEDAQAA